MLFKASVAAALLVLGVTSALAAYIPESIKKVHEIHEWHAYKSKHSKNYEDPKEDKQRMQLFLAAKEKIRLHNEAYERGEVTFTMALNHLSDYTEEEYKQLNGFIMNKEERDKIPIWTPSNNTVKLGKTRGQLLGDFEKPKLQSYFHYYSDFDTDTGTYFEYNLEKHYWGDDVVTPVKNQGQCGSCWTFATTGALEGQHAMVTGNLVSLSEQNLLDCSTENNGCHGGNSYRAFDYIKNNGGIDSENSYPYEAVQGECRFSNDSIAAMDIGYKMIEEGDEEALKLAVEQIGPISVAIDASHYSFQHYTGGGLYQEPDCSSDNVDHAVLVVGYGTVKMNYTASYSSATSTYSYDFWIVKNSWGPKWGEDGHIFMHRNQDNHCGIASMAVVPLVQ